MTRVRFGDVVNDIKVNVDRQNNPYDIYVAGDHMDSEDLTLHRWGSFATDDVGPAFIRIFKPGQVLYGSRRTYLKKIVVAPFEGITANTTFVLETKNEDEFSQRLLPFIMLSDDFTEWSIRKSKGSTNPYVLFSDLADYEFDLPSPEEQRRLADKLWAAYELKEAYKKMIAATDEMVKAQFIEMFEGQNYATKPLAQLISKSFPGEWGLEDKTENGIKVIRTTNITNDGTLDLTETVTRNISDTKLQKKLLKKGDILLERSGGTKDNPVGRVAYFNENDAYVANNFTQTLRSIGDIESYYLFHFLFYYYKMNKMKIRSMGNQTTGIQNLNMDDYMQIAIPVPPREHQEIFISIAKQAEKSKSELRQAIEKIDRVMKSLMQ